ncbi:hypothetical protein BT69DRAFT_1347554 [Atractiella rhizophila]|nr:hypothetical protein BT69DRAFT_1347554 [Atractiella rhizophila]
MTSSSVTIPLEIIGVILAFLPTCDLLQCHLVSAEWKSLARPLLISKTTIVFDTSHDPLKDGGFQRYLFRLQRFFDNELNFQYVRRISMNAFAFTFNQPLWKEPEGEEKDLMDRKLCGDDGSNILARDYVRSFIENASPYITSLTFEVDFFAFFGWESMQKWPFPSLPALTDIKIQYVPTRSISAIFPLLGASRQLKSLECTFGTADVDVAEHSFKLQSLSLNSAIVPAKLPSLSNLKDLHVHAIGRTPAELGHVANLLQLASPTVQTLNLALLHTQNEHRHLVRFPVVFPRLRQLSVSGPSDQPRRLDVLEVLPLLPHFPTMDIVAIKHSAICLKAPSFEPWVFRPINVLLQNCDFSYTGLSSLFTTKRNMISFHVAPLEGIRSQSAMDILRFANDCQGFLQLFESTTASDPIRDMELLSVVPHIHCTCCLSIVGFSAGALFSFNGKEDAGVWLAFADTINRHSFPGIQGYSIGSEREPVEVRTQAGRDAIRALDLAVEQQNVVPLSTFVEYIEDDAP